MPERSDGYQLPSWPKTLIDRPLWNSTMADIHARLVDREELEASFESLKAQGIQASLDYIQVNVAPQIANLQTSIDLAQQQIDQIIIGGSAPNALKFGNQLPAYYATAQALSEGLLGKVPTSRKVNGKELSADVELAKADVGLDKVNNTADADKPVSTAQKSAIEARVPFFQSGAALPSENIGPIWHADYCSIMTWQVFNANGAAYEGYASQMVGHPDKDGQPAARAGYVKRNGASLSKASYAALWNWALHNGRVVALGTWTAGPFVFADNGNGTFKLPDNRGEFDRAWDDGRGVDSGRGFGSWQDSDNKSHAHPYTDPGHDHDLPTDISQGSGSQMREYGQGISDFKTYRVRKNTVGITILASGGTEARSRNVAFNAVIKF